MQLEQINSLRRLNWAALSRRAIEAGVPTYRIKAAATRDELRLLIVEAESERDDA